MGAIFNVFPLILIPVIIYNIWAFATAGLAPGQELQPCIDAILLNAGEASRSENFETGARILCHLENRENPFLNVGMASGAHWIMTFGDVMVLLAILLLFIELLKSTSTGTAAIFNHALSMLVFIICLVEFLLHPAFATSVFFIIMIMSLLDVLAGVVVTIISARRDVEFAGQH